MPQNRRLSERRRLKKRNWFRLTRRNSVVAPVLEQIPEDSLKLASLRLNHKPVSVVSQSRTNPGSTRRLFDVFRRKRSVVSDSDNFTSLVPHNQMGGIRKRKNKTLRIRK
jgi:sigma54-dependent transcription regulator